MSAILFASRGPDEVRRVIAHLKAQQGVRLELVLVVTEEWTEPEYDFHPLKLRVISAKTPLTSSQAWLLGIRAAEAAVVVLCEDHCFPQQCWARALLERHREPWVAVGPSAANANPATALGRADFFLCFLKPSRTESGPQDELMGHNTSYKREYLNSLSDTELLDALHTEVLFHRNLGPENCFHETKARVEHVSTSTSRAFLGHKILGGLLFGGLRGSRWSFFRRMIYVAGAILIPPLRLWRCWSEYRHTAYRQDFLTCLPTLVLGLLFHASGEAAGYILGRRVVKWAYLRYTRIEMYRWDMVDRNDRELMRGSPCFGSVCTVRAGKVGE